ncbi:unnamed protein product, partial [Symbiodinium natans]
ATTRTHIRTLPYVVASGFTGAPSPPAAVAFFGGFATAAAGSLTPRAPVLLQAEACCVCLDVLLPRVWTSSAAAVSNVPTAPAAPRMPRPAPSASVPFVRLVVAIMPPRSLPRLRAGGVDAPARRGVPRVQADVVRLPDREMQWAPLPVRHDAGIASWVPAWVCPACARDVRLPDVPVPAQAGELCGGCGNQLRWEYVHQTRRGAAGVRPRPWSHVLRSRGCSASRGWLLVVARASRRRGLGEPNSWLYVPLLQAAAGDLLSPAAEAWWADPRTRGWWEEARRLLVASDPISRHLLAAAIRRAAEATPAYSHHIPDILERLGQEALLECYGGLRVASALDRHSDRFRAEPPTAGTEGRAVLMRRLQLLQQGGYPARAAACAKVKQGQLARDVDGERQRLERRSVVQEKLVKLNGGSGQTRAWGVGNLRDGQGYFLSGAEREDIWRQGPQQLRRPTRANRTGCDRLVPPHGSAQARRRRARNSYRGRVSAAPPGQGGLGLLAAERISPAAYWAAWADALPVLRQRYRKLRTACSMTSPRPGVRRVCRLPLPRRCGSMRRVGLTVPAGKRALAMVARGARAGRPGWQRHAALALHTFPAVAGMWLAAIPTDAATTLAPDLMHNAGPARASPVEGVGDAGMGASVALQRAVASSVLRVWTMPPSPGAPDDVPLGDVLDLAEVAPTLPGEVTPGFTPTEVPAPPEQMAGLVLGEWSGCGPPCTRDLPARNSWLYVPLLHAASATLAPAASGQWVAHPVCGVRWQALVHTLARAEPVPAAQLVALCRAVAVLDDDAEAAVVEAEALCRRLDAHADRLVSLPTAFACACDAHGYAPAARCGPGGLARSIRGACGGCGGGNACRCLACWRATSRTRSSISHTYRATAPRPASPPTLEALDAVDLLAELRGPVPTLQDVPVFLRGGLRRALEFALTALRAASAGPAEEAVRARAWKLFLLTPRMLLARTAETGAAGSRELLARVGAYERAEWPALLERARAQHRPARGASNIADAKAAAAHRRARSLRACKRGSAPGLSGARAEHYKVLLDQADALELLAEAATLLARADVPQEVAAGIALARMTAIQKPGGGVRGIATGDTFRRLVSRTLAASHAATFDEATRPFQHALSTRAGMDDALTAKLRAASVVRRLVRLRACRAPAPLRAVAGVAWARRWWSALSVACQQAVGSTALGRARAVVGPAQDSLPTVAAVLALGDPDGPSRLPLR